MLIMLMNKTAPPAESQQIKNIKARCIELEEVGLTYMHLVEEFLIRGIHPLGARKPLAYACPWLNDLNRTTNEGLSH